MGIPPDLIYLFSSLVPTELILALEWGPSVKIGNCQDVQDLDLKPLCFNLPAISAHETCSPVETSASYSALSKLLLIS